MNACVLDCSVAMAWCFQDHDGSIPHSTAMIIRSGCAFVPPLWRSEVAHVLLRAEKNSQITAADADIFLKKLRAVNIKEEHAPDETWEKTMQLARKHNLSAYDAAYLELALRLGLPLATLDRDLQKAAKKAGVPLVS